MGQICPLALHHIIVTRLAKHEGMGHDYLVRHSKARDTTILFDSKAWDTTISFGTQYYLVRHSKARDTTILFGTQRHAILPHIVGTQRHAILPHIIGTQRHGTLLSRSTQRHATRLSCSALKGMGHDYLVRHSTHTTLRVGRCHHPAAAAGHAGS